TWVELPKVLWHAASARGRPIAPLKLKRPRVGVRAPFRTDPPPEPPPVVVVVVLTGVVVVVGGPAHVPSVSQASDVLKKPSRAPQALPLHFVAELTID